MHFRVPRSTYLAVIRARQAVAIGAGLDGPEVRKLTEAIDILIGMCRSRSSHIGATNQLVEKMIENEEIDALPTETADELMNLMNTGIPLAVENSGFSDGGYG